LGNIFYLRHYIFSVTFFMRQRAIFSLSCFLYILNIQIGKMDIIMAIPKEMHGKYNEIAAMIVEFCNKKLNGDYKKSQLYPSCIPNNLYQKSDKFSAFLT
jgi:hypothetical protein